MPVHFLTTCDQGGGEAGADVHQPIEAIFERTNVEEKIAASPRSAIAAQLTGMIIE